MYCSRPQVGYPERLGVPVEQATPGRKGRCREGGGVWGRSGDAEESWSSWSATRARAMPASSTAGTRTLKSGAKCRGIKPLLPRVSKTRPTSGANRRSVDVHKLVQVEQREAEVGNGCPGAGMARASRPRSRRAGGQGSGDRHARPGHRAGTAPPRPARRERGLPPTGRRPFRRLRACGAIVRHRPSGQLSRVGADRRLRRRGTELRRTKT